MCKGTSRRNSNNTITPPPTPNTTHHDSISSSSTTNDNDDIVSSQITPPVTSCSTCELCGQNASLYCLADDAYLCNKCDGWVHGANFLANRHVRCVLCDGCCRFTMKFIVGRLKEVKVLKVEQEKMRRKKRGRSHFCEADGEGYYCCGGSGNEFSLRVVKRPFVFL